MLCVINNNTDPHLNLATEEYILKEFDEDCFMLWRNANAIIVGKHQNTLAEINIPYVEEKGISVVRRLSGGGAVFHDLGNLNFTFIMKGEDEKFIDFKKYTQPIIDILKTLDINAVFEGRNDLTIGGKKFSGNAEHVHLAKKRILHHGTLLFSSEMKDLSEALKVNPLKFQDKAVKSVRSRVTNISEHLQSPITVEEFKELIQDYVLKNYESATLYELTADDYKRIEKIADERYRKWDWNYGYSPEYGFKKGIKTKGGHVEFHLDVKKGIIEKAMIFGDFFHTYDSTEIAEALVGCKHESNAIRECLANYNINNYFNNITIDELIEAMF